MGLDSPDHTKSSPSGGTFLHDASAPATENKKLTRWANYQRLFMTATIIA
jgi:hypothetical protein